MGDTAGNGTDAVAEALRRVFGHAGFRAGQRGPADFAFLPFSISSVFAFCEDSSARSSSIAFALRVAASSGERAASSFFTPSMNA